MLRVCAAALPLLAACTDRTVTLPADGPAPQGIPPLSSLSLLPPETWSGALSTNWSTAGNWLNSVVPDSAGAAIIPADSLLASHVMPVLAADAQITDVTVGYASTLGLGGNTLRAWGDVDAVGTVTNGTLWMRGTGATLGGTVNRLKVDGRVALQRPVVSTGGVAVSGSGSLSVKNNGLFIRLP
ncbi:MAG TPA: hypothetical protein VF665_01035 [Longimicrobium sp.]|jgi:hypothetical protein|uniref:hypothetical protein n=1 Tax=Longimicrobium sp. TaxID=2029185 RepID=UPI002ED896E9